jgi:oligopeptide/dipeptide ABC transporter ATP-binding protein
MSEAEPRGELLRVEGLAVDFEDGRAVARAVRGVGLSLGAGESLALVGESGSGKTAVAKAIMRLHDPRRVRVAGSILLGGRDIAGLGEREMEGIRGKLVSMVFQDPMTSLNPVLRVGDQVAEAVMRSCRMSKASARAVALELFAKAGMPKPELLFRRYPHEFSGGMLQRAMILIALAASPKLLIADEPTTALDVTVQAQVLDLIEAERRALGTALLLVTHDMGVVAERTERAAVMYAGLVVESGPTLELLSRPLHPYTEGLLDALPRRGARGERLKTIEGSPPSVFEMTPGCPFAPRCRYATPRCRIESPGLSSAGGARLVSCHLSAELSLRGIA